MNEAETSVLASERALLPNRTRCAICGLRIVRWNLIRHLDSHDREARRLLRTRARLVDQVNRIDAALASLGVRADDVAKTRDQMSHD